MTENISNTKSKSIYNTAGYGIWYFIATATSLWTLGSIFYLSFFPGWLQTITTLMTIIALSVAYKNISKKHFSLILVAFILVLQLLPLLDPAKNNRSWAKDQEFIPEISVVGNQIQIKNFRFCHYRSKEDFDVQWEIRTFHLNKLVGVDFVVEPFSTWRGLAHTFLTFSFSDGEHISISVEIRREQNETYSVFAGLFNNYEIMYLIGDERDLIGLRANIRKNPVHLYPIKANKDQVKKLFLSMINRANHLIKNPEYYNTLFNTCSTNISKHLQENFELNLGFDPRIIFPGYADSIAYELGLINTKNTLEETRKLFLINNRSQFLQNEKAWSKQIRKINNQPQD